MDQVRDHLKEYLDRSRSVMSGKQATGTIDENLYLLIIQCFEVSIFISRCGLGRVCGHIKSLWLPQLIFTSMFNVTIITDSTTVEPLITDTPKWWIPPSNGHLAFTLADFPISLPV